jgi:hypothetical protein
MLPFGKQQDILDFPFDSSAFTSLKTIPQGLKPSSIFQL